MFGGLGTRYETSYHVLSCRVIFTSRYVTRPPMTWHIVRHMLLSCGFESSHVHIDVIYRNAKILWFTNEVYAEKKIIIDMQ